MGMSWWQVGQEEPSSTARAAVERAGAAAGRGRAQSTLVNVEGDPAACWPAPSRSVSVAASLLAV